MFDVIIVGSGAAGTFSAYSLRGLRTLMLDVGFTPPEESLTGSLYDLEDKDQAGRQIIGAHFESLNDIEYKKLTPKVKAPLMRYVVQKPECSPKILSEGFSPVISYAEGGLANAWGAQVYRFNDEDLKGWPINTTELEPYYDDLIEHIGISGTDDDLTQFLGDSIGMLPPLQLNSIGTEIFGRYQRNVRLFNRNGIYIGYPRMAVLSIDYAGRKGCEYDNLEFFKSRSPAIYSPAFTLQSMVEKKEIDYLPRYFVEKYEEQADCVTVIAKNIDNSSLETFHCRKLILCLGALNTARLVLLSHDDFSTRLPVIENPCSFTPLVSLSRIGMPEIRNRILLNFVWLIPGSCVTN